MSEFMKLLLEMVVVVAYLIFFIRLMGRKEKQTTPTDLMYIVLLMSISWDMVLEPQYNVLHIFVTLSF
ncbi:hypothetical protein GN156_07355 [bacterium LRH843]|nr:hypothetical protein [bacterium LRH843]